MSTIQRPALYEIKTPHSKEMYSTWFGDDVIRFRSCCGVAKSVRDFDATYHDVTPIKLDSIPHYELRFTNAIM